MTAVGQILPFDCSLLDGRDGSGTRTRARHADPAGIGRVAPAYARATRRRNRLACRPRRGLPAGGPDGRCVPRGCRRISRSLMSKGKPRRGNTGVFRAGDRQLGEHRLPAGIKQHSCAIVQVDMPRRCCRGSTGHNSPSRAKIAGRFSPPVKLTGIMSAARFGV